MGSWLARGPDSSEGWGGEARILGILYGDAPMKWALLVTLYYDPQSRFGLNQAESGAR